MASEKPNRDDYFVARPLEASKHAFIVELSPTLSGWRSSVRFAVTRMTFTRAEARDVAYHVIEVSQQIDEEDE
jgi:hypothetical protein